MCPKFNIRRMKLRKRRVCFQMHDQAYRLFRIHEQTVTQDVTSLSSRIMKPSIPFLAL